MVNTSRDLLEGLECHIMHNGVTVHALTIRFSPNFSWEKKVCAKPWNHDGYRSVSSFHGPMNGWEGCLRFFFTIQSNVWWCHISLWWWSQGCRTGRIVEREQSRHDNRVWALPLEPGKYSLCANFIVWCRCLCACIGTLAKGRAKRWRLILKEFLWPASMLGVIVGKRTFNTCRKCPFSCVGLWSMSSLGCLRVPDNIFFLF